jgi:hypothetical protein
VDDWTDEELLDYICEDVYTRYCVFLRSSEYDQKSAFFKAIGPTVEAMIRYEQELIKEET